MPIAIPEKKPNKIKFKSLFIFKNFNEKNIANKKKGKTKEWGSIA